GIGTWTKLSGPGVITASSDSNTTVTGVTAGDTTILIWTISNFVCGSTADSVMLINVAPAPTANADTNQTLCNTSTFTMSGNNPSPGIGTWTKLSGPG